MRVFFLGLLLCVGGVAFANEIVYFGDDNSGFEIEIPPGIKPSWNISNFENGKELTFLSTDEFSAEDMFIIVLGKIPLDCENYVYEPMYSLIIDQIEENLPLGKLYVDTDGLYIQAQSMPGLTSEQGLVDRIRFYLASEFLEDEILADLHLFVKDGNAYAVVTGVYYDSFYLDYYEEDLDSFSEAVIRTMQFKT